MRDDAKDRKRSSCEWGQRKKDALRYDRTTLAERGVRDAALQVFAAQCMRQPTPESNAHNKLYGAMRTLNRSAQDRVPPAAARSMKGGPRVDQGIQLVVTESAAGQSHSSATIFFVNHRERNSLSRIVDAPGATKPRAWSHLGCLFEPLEINGRRVVVHTSLSVDVDRKEREYDTQINLRVGYGLCA
jgi:hypothetical protein